MCQHAADPLEQKADELFLEGMNGSQFTCVIYCVIYYTDKAATYLLSTLIHL